MFNKSHTRTFLSKCGADYWFSVVWKKKKMRKHLISWCILEFLSLSSCVASYLMQGMTMWCITFIIIDELINVHLTRKQTKEFFSAFSRILLLCMFVNFFLFLISCWIELSFHFWHFLSI